VIHAIDKVLLPADKNIDQTAAIRQESWHRGAEGLCSAGTAPRWGNAHCSQPLFRFSRRSPSFASFARS
jgi:hypothetical protein